MAKKKSAKDRNQGLKMMNFHVPPALYQKFKVKVVRDRATIRAVAEAMLTAYVEGEFDVEEKNAGSEKG